MGTAVLGVLLVGVVVRRRHKLLGSYFCYIYIYSTLSDFGGGGGVVPRVQYIFASSFYLFVENIYFDRLKSDAFVFNSICLV